MIQNFHSIVIYGVCHVFVVNFNGTDVAYFREMSVLSFHVIKILNTFESGAVSCLDETMRRHIDLLKKFGFIDEKAITAKVLTLR